MSHPPRGGYGIRKPAVESAQPYFPNTWSTGVIVTEVGCSFSTPITLSSSSSSGGLGASYLIVETASEVSRYFRSLASLAMITTERFWPDRCFLMARFTSASVSFESRSRRVAVNSPMPYHCESRA